MRTFQKTNFTNTAYSNFGIFRNNSKFNVVITITLKDIFMENKNNLTKEEDLVLKIATEILEKYKIAFEELAK